MPQLKAVDQAGEKNLPVVDPSPPSVLILMPLGCTAVYCAHPLPQTSLFALLPTLKFWWNSNFNIHDRL